MLTRIPSGKVYTFTCKAPSGGLYALEITTGARPTVNGRGFAFRPVTRSQACKALKDARRIGAHLLSVCPA